MNGTMRAVTMAAAVGMLALAGCRTDSATHRAEGVDKGMQPATAATPSAPAYSGPSGAVSGTVHFNGPQPKYPPIDTSMDPACAMTQSSSTLPVEQIVDHSGKLANVFVYVKSGPDVAMRTGYANPAPVVLDQQGCRYVPHVIGVMAGGSVEFRNSDPTMHNVHTTSGGANEEIDVSMQPRGRSVVKQFKQPELMIPVRCNNHPWMQAYINVSKTPFFAVTDADGHFTLKGLPPGQYTIGAVQEKLGEQDAQVTVAANGTATADFTYAK